MNDFIDRNFEPVARYISTSYTIQLSRDAIRELRYKDCPFIIVSVDSFGMVDITKYSWFGEHSDSGKKHSIVKEIIDWLVEWELVQIRQIGPEDADWFATEKLINTPQENYWFELSR